LLANRLSGDLLFPLPENLDPALALQLACEQGEGRAQDGAGHLASFTDSEIQTTLDLYTQGDSDETRAAQGEFLQALGMRTERVQ
jgi:hypothetical protein